MVGTSSLLCLADLVSSPFFPLTFSSSWRVSTHLSMETPFLSQICFEGVLLEQEVQVQARVRALISAQSGLASMRAEMGSFPLYRMFSSL